MTTEHSAYCEHVAACDDAEHGRWCQDCRDLLWDADVADGRG